MIKPLFLIKNDESVYLFSRPQTFQDWLNLIEDKYFDERDDLVRQTLQTAYNEVECPFSFLLHVIHRAFFDLFSKRVPITFYTLDEMDNWLGLKVFVIFIDLHRELLILSCVDPFHH